MDITKVDEKYRSLFGNIIEIYEIFRDHFGEENVDFQSEVIEGFLKDNTSIIKGERYCNSCNKEFLIRFPEVKVENENGEYIYIWNLFVLIPVDLHGHLLNTLSFIRSKYSIEQLEAGYLHSHTTKIRYIGSPKVPCFGTGPIRNTINTLTHTSNTDLWRLFCIELQMFVATESLMGIPYIRMVDVNSPGESIKDNCTLTRYLFKNRFKNVLTDFITDLLLSRKIKFKYVNGSYSIAMNYYKFLLYVSNEFIEYWNTHWHEYYTIDAKIIENDIIKRAVWYNEKLKYADTDIRNDYTEYKKHPILYFKGLPVYLEIVDFDFRYIRILHPTIINRLIESINMVINFECATINKKEYVGKERYYI